MLQRRRAGVGEVPRIERGVQGAAEEVRTGVGAILEDVRARGDEAVRDWTERLDGIRLEDARVPLEDWERAEAQVRDAARDDLQRAIRQLEAFHREGRTQEVAVTTSPGVRCEKRVRALQTIGAYVPGGSAPLVSTLLMIAVPARLAGCKRRIVCTPPGPNGEVDPHLLVAARLCGIDEIFRVGGAQAIGALAFGTGRIPRADKLFGPGNAWVSEAKTQVSAFPGGPAIDLPAGPSEVLVIADAAADPVFVAADLLSQAEHGPDSQVVLVSDAPQLVDAVQVELERQLGRLTRKDVAQRALQHSVALEVHDLDQALDVANAYAPEHLILQVQNPRAYLDGVFNAGSVFLGPWAPEAVGDYASGTNHVLPTGGAARAWSGLGVAAFEKTISVQELTAAGLEDLGPVVARLSDLEGLDGHGAAVRLRLDALRSRANTGDGLGEAATLQEGGR